MASKLPTRWDVDKRLLPAEAPYPQPVARHGPAAAGRSRAGGRRPRRAVPAAVPAARGLQRGRAHGHRRARGSAAGAGPAAARGASGGGTGAPGIDPIGAATLDAALGGIVFGDELAKLAEEGDDPASRVGELLESAAERQADGRVGVAARGLAAVRCRGAWSRRGRPRRRSGSSTAIDRGRGSRRTLQPRGAARRRDRVGRWARCGAPGAARGPRAVGGGRRCIAGRVARALAAAPDPRLRPVWEVPRGLRWYVGARAWRSPWRWLTVRARDPAARARHRPDLGAT